MGPSPRSVRSFAEEHPLRQVVAEPRGTGYSLASSILGPQPSSSKKMRRRVNELCFIAAVWTSMFGLGCGGVDEADAPITVFPAEPHSVLQSNEGRLTIEVRTGPSQPPGRGKTDVQFVVRDADGSLVDGLAIAATPWMPIMGHGTPVKPEVSQEGTGTYALRNVSMYMPGLWELRTTFSGVVMDKAAPAFDVP
jgi:YtkA-like